MVKDTLVHSEQDNTIQNLLLIVALLMGFIFVVSITIYFIKEQYGLSCSCKVSLPIVIAILTSLGVFVGILTYYFFLKSFSKKKDKIFGNIEKTLNFLNQEERSILLILIKNKGVIAQSNLSSITNIDAVKLHRRLVHLESKGIIHKIKQGMTNKIELADDFKELFIK